MAKETKHTPGPWEGNDELEEGIFIGGPGRTNFLAVAFREGFSQEEMEANARLIAAAPELLEALKVALNVLQYGAASHEEQQKLLIINTAIAKAQGTK